MGNSASTAVYSNSNVCVAAATVATMALRLMVRDPTDNGLPLETKSEAAVVARNLVGRAPVCNITLVTPQRKVLNCGTGGTLTQPSVLRSVSESSLDACRDVCLDDTQCISLSYTAQTQNCTLHNKALIDQRYRNKDKQNGTVRYNHRCWKKTCPPPERCQTATLTAPGRNYDSNFWILQLPFNLQMYGVSNNTIHISTNGWISLHYNDYPFYSAGTEAPTSALPDYGNAVVADNYAYGLSYSIIPFWADQQVRRTADHSQSIVAETSGNAPNRQLRIFWKTSDAGDATKTYSYTLFYDESVPGVYKVTFDSFGGGPASAAVTGAETNPDATPQQSVTWQYQPNGADFVVPEVPYTITIDTNSNTVNPQ